MTGLVINENACRGCGKCVRACASHGIAMVGEKPQRKAVVTDGCVLCGLCVDSCPFDAIALVRDEDAAPATLEDHCGVWVFAQQHEGVVEPVVYELLAKGRELANARQAPLVALVGLGANPEAADPSAQLIACGADEVILCRDERLAQPITQTYARWLCRLAEQRKPDILLFGATVFGRELAPTVAARLRTGLTADCTVLSIDDETGLLHQTRPAFGGNLMATIVCPNHRPQMATVRPGVLTAAVPNTARAGIVTETFLEDADTSLVRILEELPSGDTDAITNAEVLVVVGRGIGSQKNLPLMERLAQQLGAKLGCSRPLVESGWCEYKHQVGQTGVSVAPKLLISLGVSGAIQHVAGIGGAECVIAVNSDPTAPICDLSQYCVIGDCVEIAKTWVEELEKR